jgi:hypothetical protein
VNHIKDNFYKKFIKLNYYFFYALKINYKFQKNTSTLNHEQKKLFNISVIALIRPIMMLFYYNNIDKVYLYTYKINIKIILTLILIRLIQITLINKITDQYSSI